MRNTTVAINGEDVPGIIALPPEGSGPAVIVIQEWWGLVPHIHEVVQRFASEGFVALAVDHYRGVETTEPDEAQKLMIGLNIGQVGQDLAAAAAALLEREEVTSQTVCVVGFCMGGGLALLGPTVSPAVGCVASFYPAMPWPDYAPDWSSYAGRKAMIHKAESDEEWAGPALTAYADAIVENGGTVEVFEYPGSVHAFFNDERPEVYQHGNAELAWRRTVDFFRACGA